MESVTRPEWVDSIMDKLKQRDLEVASRARIEIVSELIQEILAAHEHGDLLAVADWLHEKIEQEKQGLEKIAGEGSVDANVRG